MCLHGTVYPVNFEFLCLSSCCCQSYCFEKTCPCVAFFESTAWETGQLRLYQGALCLANSWETTAPAVSSSMRAYQIAKHHMLPGLCPSVFPILVLYQRIFVPKNVPGLLCHPLYCFLFSDCGSSFAKSIGQMLALVSWSCWTIVFNKEPKRSSPNRD